jgi:hypothetical protein
VARPALNGRNSYAVLAAISYSVAREWFNTKGFPRVHGVVFWQDFRNGEINKLVDNQSRNTLRNLPSRILPQTSNALPQPGCLPAPRKSFLKR